MSGSEDTSAGRGRSWRGPVARWTQALISPEVSPRIEQALAERRRQVPVLWLLGKTGAGKSSVVQRLTGDSRARIGNGYEPCTRSADLYDHPQEAPVMRFLDTRGLGEAGYDPHEDLAACLGGSHALLILTRVDDTEQSALRRALERLGREADTLATLHLHTALHTLDDPDERRRAIAHNRDGIAAALGRSVPQVSIDFSDPDDGLDDPDTGLETLRGALIDLVPALEAALAAREEGDAEQEAWLANRREVLGYASAAGAVDALPGIGLVGVPGVQGKLLHALAARYDHPWGRAVVRDFVTVLGSTFLTRYLLSFLGREAAKFVPVYGQTAGAATAAGISFASTYALGRAACLYLYRRKTEQPVDRQDLQQAFRDAFRERPTDPVRAPEDPA